MDFAKAKQIHDILMSNAPASVDHPRESCEYCTDIAASTEGRKEGNGMDPIYTQEQADALVEAAVSKALATAEEDKAKAVKEAKGELKDEIKELKAEVASLQEARDTDQMALAAAQEKVTTLETEIASRDEAVARLARREERLAKVSEVAKFTDEYVQANADRWVDMSDEQFASILDAYKDMASNLKVETSETEVPDETAMSNTRTENVKVSARTALFQHTLRGGSN